MRIFTSKKTMVAVLLFCLCNTVYSQTTLTVNTDAGQLSTKISEAQKNTITDLKVSGKINGTDIAFIREMAGRALNNNAKTEGKLVSLDISDAQIVSGGGNYYTVKRGLSSFSYQTQEDNVVSPYMFSGLTNLTTLKLPKGTTKIEKNAVSDCSNLKECSIPSAVTSIADYAFAKCSKLTSVVIPRGVSSLGVGAFKSCDELSSVTFAEGNGLKVIAKEAFASNSSLKSITLPALVKEISESAFKECTALKTVNFSENLEKIGAGAFENCIALVTLSEFPATLSEIGDKAFLNTAVTAYSVAEGNEEYSAVDGVLYDADQISLELYPAGRADATFKFPETVSSIEEYAFAYAKNLQHLELPNHLTNVGESAFTFSKITKLTALADGLSIGKKAFSNCAELETVEFKGAVSGIEEGAFQNDRKLSSVTFVGNSAPDFGKHVFYPRASVLKIYVPEGYVEKYKDKISNTSAVLGSKYEVLANTSTGILDASLDSNVVETARYNVDGTKATTRTKGINIVKLSNGKVIKTIEK